MVRMRNKGNLVCLINTTHAHPHPHSHPHFHPGGYPDLRNSIWQAPASAQAAAQTLGPQMTENRKKVGVVDAKYASLIALYHVGIQLKSQCCTAIISTLALMLWILGRASCCWSRLHPKVACSELRSKDRWQRNQVTVRYREVNLQCVTEHWRSYWRTSYNRKHEVLVLSSCPPVPAVSSLSISQLLPLSHAYI